MKLNNIFLVASLTVLNAFTLHSFANNEVVTDSIKDQLTTYLFKEGAPKRMTDGFLVIQNGKIIYENYANGYNENKKHISWSMAKTFAGFLVGLAEQDGYIQLSDHVRKYIPEFQTEATILDLLNMSSGVNFSEVYKGVPVSSDVVSMLYLKGRKSGFANYILKLPKSEEKPGDYFYYSSGDTNILMEVLRRAMPETVYNSYPHNRLFSAIGMKNVTFEKDKNGMWIGSSYIYATMRDFAKLGELLMNQGKLNGSQFISEQYWSLINQVATGVNKKAVIGTDPRRAYSTQITTNRAIEGRSLPSQYKNLPEDALIAIGVNGQLVIGVPSSKTVIVKLANDKGSAVDRDKIFEMVGKLVVENGGKWVPSANSNLNQKLSNENVSPPVAIDLPGASKTAHYLRVPGLIASLAAKEYCSCRFVEKFTKDECKAKLKRSLPILPVISENSSKGLIKTFFIVKRSAKFQSLETGCLLK